MAENTYILFKWVLNTKKGLTKKGFFLFELPNELKRMLNIPESMLIKNGLYLDSKVESHTRVKISIGQNAAKANDTTTRVKSYFKLRKKSKRFKPVLAQNQATSKAPYITLRFPPFFRLKHICNVLHFLTPKSDEWIKYRREGSKEIYPYDYGLIELATIEEIGQKDILITF